MRSTLFSCLYPFSHLSKSKLLKFSTLTLQVLPTQCKVCCTGSCPGMHFITVSPEPCTSSAIHQHNFIGLHWRGTFWPRLALCSISCTVDFSSQPCPTNDVNLDDLRFFSTFISLVFLYSLHLKIFFLDAFKTNSSFLFMFPFMMLLFFVCVFSKLLPHKTLLSSSHCFSHLFSGSQYLDEVPNPPPPSTPPYCSVHLLPCHCPSSL